MLLVMASLTQSTRLIFSKRLGNKYTAEQQVLNLQYFIRYNHTTTNFKMNLPILSSSNFDFNFCLYMIFVDGVDSAIVQLPAFAVCHHV